MFIINFFKHCWTIAIPFLLLIIICTVLFFKDYEHVEVVANIGSIIILTVNLLYITYQVQTKT